MGNSALVCHWFEHFEWTLNFLDTSYKAKQKRKLSITAANLTHLCKLCNTYIFYIGHIFSFLKLFHQMVFARLSLNVIYIILFCLL